MPSLLDQSDLSDLAERLVSAARRAGADQADAIAVRSISLSVDVRDGDIEESQRSEGDDLGLRVIVGHKQAVVSTNDLKSDGFDALAERAVAMARAAPDDRFAGLADPSLLASKLPDLDLLDPEMPDVGVLETRAREAEAAALAVAGVTKSGGASASAGIGGMVLVTSHGFHGATIGSRHGVAMTAIAGEGTGMERDYDFSSTLHAADLENAQAIGRHAGERAVKRLNPRKVATRRVPVVFDSRISGSLVGHLASAANGSSIARKTSFLREKLGAKIFASGIDIIDDPLRPRGLRSRPFDAEGIAGRSRKQVDDGVLKTWQLDSATARELDLQTTGHAQRGVSSTPSPGPSNLHLAPGAKNPPQPLVYGQRPRHASRTGAGAQQRGQRHGILQRLVHTLAQVRQHRVRRVAEQRQPPAAPSGQRRTVVHPPLEPAAAWPADRSDDLPDNRVPAREVRG